MTRSQKRREEGRREREGGGEERDFHKCLLGFGT